MRRGRYVPFRADFDYSGYSDRALAEARELWRRELQNEAFTWVGIPADRDLASRKIAAIRAEQARRQEAKGKSK